MCVILQGVHATHVYVCGIKAYVRWHTLVDVEISSSMYRSSRYHTGTFKNLHVSRLERRKYFHIKNLIALEFSGVSKTSRNQENSCVEHIVLTAWVLPCANAMEKDTLRLQQLLCIVKLPECTPNPYAVFRTFVSSQSLPLGYFSTFLFPQSLPPGSMIQNARFHVSIPLCCFVSPFSHLPLDHVVNMLCLH